MFESTLTDHQPELMRASSYLRYLDESEEQPWMTCETVQGTRLSGLSPSLHADLLRSETPCPVVSDSLDLLALTAGCVRHANQVTMHLSCLDRVWPLSVFPLAHLVHCPVSHEELARLPLNTARVMHVEQAVLSPPGGDNAQAFSAAAEQCFPLAPWLWTLAWRGARSRLLPEISGRVAYRVSPSMAWDSLALAGALRSSFFRMQTHAVGLRELANWPGMDKERASRLLNALYLQGGLIISRVNREAFSDSWWGSLER